MTDAKAVSQTLRPSATVIALLNAATEQITTLTRERDAAVQDAARQLDLRYAANRELVALQRETDAMRKVYDAARVCHWREDDHDFGTWRTGCGHLWSFNAGGPEENDTKFCQYCGGALNAACTADATSSFADSLIGIHEATQCDGCGMFRCRCTRADDAEVSA